MKSLNLITIVILYSVTVLLCTCPAYAIQSSFGSVYPQEFRTVKLICDPGSTPRAEEVCIRPCLSDKDCLYKAPQLVYGNLPDYTYTTNIQMTDAIYAHLVAPPDTSTWSRPFGRALYTTIKKEQYLDWMCNSTLGYCQPYTDNACNWGWDRVEVTNSVSLPIELSLGIPKVVDPEFNLVEKYVRDTAYRSHVYLKYIMDNSTGGGEWHPNGVISFTSYMCQCKPNAVFASCGVGTCQSLVGGNHSLNTNNIQFKAALKISTGSITLQSSTTLIHQYYMSQDSNLVGESISNLQTVCICPPGYHGPSCNNVIDHCSTLYCESRGLCAREIDSLSTPNVQVNLLIDQTLAGFPPNSPDNPALFYADSIPRLKYWATRDQLPIYMAITSYLAPPIAKKLSVRTCFCEEGYTASTDPNSSPFVNDDASSTSITYPYAGGCNSIDYDFVCCNKWSGTWPLANKQNTVARFPINKEELCMPYSGTGGYPMNPCTGATCYGFNCELTCDQLCSGNSLDPVLSCTYPRNFSDSSAHLHNLCLQCKPGTGPPALPNRWTNKITNTKIYSNVMRFCNLIYSTPYDNPGGVEQQCGGYGYSIDLDKVASILGLNRTLLQVIRRASAMELELDPVVLINSYVNEAANAYIDEDNIPRLIKFHPAFSGKTISAEQWKRYTDYYYNSNVNTRCICTDGFVNTASGSCMKDGCDTWTTTHVSDTSGIAPNGQTCGGSARSHNGCIVVNSEKRCTCREGFTGTACEQVLCAHANGSGCSGNGYCDKNYNQCVCKPGFVGIACEIKLENATPCNGNGQQTKSYPLPSYEQDTEYEIPPEIDVKVEWL
jgi:hypothetical protein